MGLSRGWLRSRRCPKLPPPRAGAALYPQAHEVAGKVIVKLFHFLAGGEAWNA